jgi:hypothetical protein
MKLDLKKALDSILRDDKRGDNPIPDPLRFSYFTVQKENLLKEMSEKLEKRNWSVSPLLTIDVPKGNFTIRPMGRPEIQDWVIYQALVDYLIPKIISKLSKRSFSILNYKSQRRRILSWQKFDAKSRLLYERGYRYVVSTDISSYFENIDLDELRNKIINHVDSRDTETKKVVDFLYEKFLVPWSSGRIKNFGLPQGPTASTFLGDVYLDNIDREMEEEAGYFRYMDDIRIFCKNEISARLALIKLIKALRKYKLNINAKKTRILRNTEVEKSLFDPRKPILDSIQTAFDSKDEKQIKAVTPILIDILRGGFSEKNIFDKRHINFSIFRLSVLKASGLEFDEKSVISLLTKNFLDRPQHADDFCSFLAIFNRSKKIKDFFLKFLTSKENIYEWQEMHVLRALLELQPKINSSLLRKFRDRFKDRNRHWAVRSLYGLLVGKYGKNTDRELLVDEFEHTDIEELKKNIILAVQELGSASRSRFYQRIQHTIKPTVFISYVKNLEKPIYFRPYDRITIEIFEQAASNIKWYE